MTTVWKYAISDLGEVVLPRGAQILHVDMQGLSLNFWALVNSDEPPETRMFDAFGTGMEIPPSEGTSHKYIGTTMDRIFVWHVFEIVQEPRL